MTTAMERARAAAEERLLEAELATVLGHRRAAIPSSPRPRPWLAAAIVLLGLGAVIGTWWLRREPPGAAQDPAPAPLPDAVHADRTRDLAGLPVDVHHLACRLDGPADLAELARLQQLRRLVVLAYDPKAAAGRLRGVLDGVVGVHRGWAAPAPGTLLPLASLPRLESLALPSQLAVDGAQLAALRSARALRELSVGAAAVVDDTFAERLAALPALRALELREVPLDAAAVTLLERVGLRELRLQSCPGVGESALRALAALSSLEALELEGVGRPSLGHAPADAAAAAVTPLAGPSLEGLRRLPRLRSVRFHGCVLDDTALAALPDRIEELWLSSASGFTAEGLQSLQSLPRLRVLRFRERSGYGLLENHRIPPEQAADALAEVLEGVRLRECSFTGVPTPRLVEALAAQPELTQLSLSSMVGDHSALDLAPLGRSPSLEHLSLLNQPHLGDEDLRPLAACRTLRSLRAHACGRITAAAATALLPGVEVVVVPLDGPRGETK
ncbi:MAG: hypothetical protein AB7O97_21335 [Planctomycetota bacterium]